MEHYSLRPRLWVIATCFNHFGVFWWHQILVIHTLLTSNLKGYLATTINWQPLTHSCSSLSRSQNHQWTPINVTPHTHTFTQLYTPRSTVWQPVHLLAWIWKVGNSRIQRKPILTWWKHARLQTDSNLSSGWNQWPCSCDTAKLLHCETQLTAY